MTIDQFRRTLRKRSPPAHASDPLAALWWAAKGDWNRAHEIVMDASSPEAAWVHAYLHRVEGDSSNARYWYGKAGRAPSKVPFDAEWDEIVGALL
jgi:hypothetical protein